MKTKFITKLSSFLLLLILCVATLSGCYAPWNGPETNADVTGNGGLAVQKGQYLYFVNGYTDKANMKAGDNKGGAAYSGIYSAKLDENNNLEYNEDGTIKNCTKIVDKVAGYNNTALYIFGDYLYFSTPYADKVVKEGSDQQEHNFKLTDFFSVKLDGANLSKIYSTTNDSDSLQFSFVKTASQNDVNLAVYDGSKLVIVNCSTKAQSVVSQNVTAVAMPKVSAYKHSNNQISMAESQIYYTRSKLETESNKGNVLAYTVVGENTENIILRDDTTYTLKSASKDALVVSFQAKDDTNACNRFIALNSNGEPQTDINVIANQKLDKSGVSDLLLCGFEEGNPIGVVVKNGDNKLAFIPYGQTAVLLNDSLSLTPLCISGNYVYSYDDNKSLYRTNYKQALVAQDKDACTQIVYDSTKLVEEGSEETLQDIYFDAKTNFSIAGNNVYFYIAYEGDSDTGYYLNKINLLEAEKTATLVGDVQSNHIKTETEDEE